MKSRETILDELKQISPLLAGIEPVNPYSVPYLYFEELGEKVLKAISAPDEFSAQKEFSVKGFNQKTNSENLSFGEELPGILNELKAGKPMTVPTGYFDSFASNVLQKIKEEASKEENLNATPVIEMKSVTGTPEQHELTLVPEDAEPVFEKSISHAGSETGGKVIRMAPRRKLYFQLAAAAVTIGIIILAVFLYNGNQQPFNNVASTSEIDAFSLETLESFVEGQTIDFIPTVAAAPSDLKAEDMREVIGDISEEALQLYLNTQNSHLETQVN